MWNKIISRSLPVLLLCACSPADKAQQPAPARAVPSKSAAATRLYTPNPSIPESVELWGKRWNLDRNDLYERFDRELTAMTYTHGTTLLTIKRANRVFPVIAPILRRNGLPEDMVYLAAIESNLDERALSPAKAAGIWQFMPATARQYGLEVNDDVDERYNLEKATVAACKMLKAAHAKYGDWNTVACSYNAGMARISGELASQQQQSALDLYLVTETSRYPFRIMAMKQIMENPARFGFMLEPSQLYFPVETEVVEVNRPVENWVDWARQHGISYAQLREANPWIRSKSLPNKSGKTYKVHVPKKESLYRSTAAKPVYNPDWVKH